VCHIPSPSNRFWFVNPQIIFGDTNRKVGKQNDMVHSSHVNYFNANTKTSACRWHTEYKCVSGCRGHGLCALNGTYTWYMHHIWLIMSLVQRLWDARHASSMPTQWLHLMALACSSTARIIYGTTFVYGTFATSSTLKLSTFDTFIVPIFLQFWAHSQ
jgi:hypothetical protein